MRNPRTVFLVLLLSLAGVVLLLDRIVFQHLIFYPENRSGWDSFRWYNFEYHLQKLEHRRAQGKSERPFIVVTGSSIAKYSVQRDVLQREIQRLLGKPVDVEMIVHAAMLPTDLAAYMSRIKKLDPDILVYITNPADLDMERYVPPWEAGPDYSFTASFLYLKDRIPVSMYYPGKFASEYGGMLSAEKYFSLFFREILYSLRFREQWADVLEYNYKAYTGKPIKSYLNYQGIPIGGELWRDGFSGACFFFPVSALNEKGAMWLQIPSSMQNVKDYSIHFHHLSGLDKLDIREKGEFTQCENPGEADEVFNVNPGRSGWQRFDLPSRLREGDDAIIYVSVSHVEDDNGNAMEVHNGDPVYTGKGLRLPANFGLTEPVKDNYLVRRRSLEDVLLSQIDIKNYSKRFTRRVEPDDWRSDHNIGLWQLNGLRLGKYYSLWYDFDENTPQARAISELVEDASTSMSVLVINNPENPLSLAAYERSDWYAGYLHFLDGLTNRGEKDIRTADLHGMGEERMFVDPHHLSYDGMMKMAPVYAWQITDILKDQSRDADSNIGLR